MKSTIVTPIILLATVFAALAVDEAPTKPDIPIITARSGVTGKDTKMSRDSEGFQNRATSSIAAVDVDLKFFNKPAKPYTIECYFVAKGSSSSELFIYDCQRLTESAQHFDTRFNAPSLLESSNRWISLPASGRTAFGEEIVSITYTQKVTGSKYMGWVVRVKSMETVVRIEGSSQNLKKLAEDQPAFFDAAADE